MDARSSSASVRIPERLPGPRERCGAPELAANLWDKSCVVVTQARDEPPPGKRWAVWEEAWMTSQAFASNSRVLGA
jgi:hypothetical protein